MAKDDFDPTLDPALPPAPPPAAEPESEAEQERRRHGFWRRWVIRPLIWLAVLFVAVIGAAEWMLDSARGRAWAKALIVEKLTPVLGRPISVQDVRFDLFPLGVEVRGFEIGGGERFPDAPFLRVEQAWIEADVNALLRRKIHLNLVKVERPRLDLRFVNGADNMLKVARRNKKGVFELVIDRVEVERGVVQLEERQVNLSFTADDIRGLLNRVGRTLKGPVGVRAIELTLPGGDPVTLGLQAEIGLNLQDRLIEFPKASVTGDGLALSADGACDWANKDGNSNKCTFQTRGKVQGSVVGALGYYDRLAGELDIDGVLNWRTGATGWRGRVQSPAASIQGIELRDFDAQLVADRYSIRAEISQAHFGRLPPAATADTGGRDAGQIHGSVLVDLRLPEDPLTLELDVQDVDLGLLLASLEVPVKGLDAFATGRLDFESPSRRLLQGNGTGEFTLRPLGNGQPLPLAGSMPLRFVEGRLILGSESQSKLALAGERHDLLLGGSWDLESKSGGFDFEITTTAAEEILPLVLEPEMLAEQPPWLIQSGRGQVLVDLDVVQGAFQVATQLDLEDVTTPRLGPARVRGQIDLDREAVQRLQLDIGRPTGAMILAGRIPFGGVQPIEMAIDAFTWPLVEAKPWLEFPLPLDGNVSGHMSLSIAPEGNSGRLQARVAPALFAETIDFQQVETTLAWGAGRMNVQDLAASMAGGTLRASGEIGFDAGDLDLRLRAAGLQLNQPPIAGWLAETALDGGELTFESTIGGTLDKPAITFDGALSDAVLAGRAIPGRQPIKANWDGERLELESRLLDAITVRGGGVLRLEEPAAGAAVAANPPASGAAAPPAAAVPATPPATATGAEAPPPGGALELVPGAPPAPAAPATQVAATPPAAGAPAAAAPLAAPSFDDLRYDLELGFQIDNLAVLAEVLADPEAETGSLVERGAVKGALFLRGSTGAETEMRLRVDEADVVLAGRHLRSQGPAELASGPEGGWTLGGLRLDEAGAEDPGVLQIDGQILPELALQVKARVPAVWVLQLIDPTYAPTGMVSFDGRVTGTFTEPLLSGRGEIENVNLAIAALGGEGLRDLRGGVVFSPGRVELRDVRGTLGGGDLRVLGSVDLPSAQRGLGYALQVEGRALRWRALEGWILEGDVDLTFKSAGAGHLIAGSADLARLEFRQEIKLDAAQLLRDFLRRQRLEVQRVDGTLGNVALNLQIRANQTVRVNNNLADLVGSADFTVRGTLASPVLFGEIEVVRGGRLRYNDADYEVERGRLVFADPFKIDPEIDLVARTRVRDFDIDLAVFGTLGRLETRFSSQPPLPDVEVFRLLAEGDFGSEPLRPAPAAGEEGLSAATFLYGQAASAIGERVSSLFGFDKFRVDPLVGSGGGDNLATARITVGKRLSKDIFVTYSVDPSSTENSRLQVEWQLAEGLVLVLSQNGDNSYSADARWDTSF